MAKAGAVWGIDIGQCAVKALKCRRHPEDETRIVAEAFDYIEYPRILSQQGADSSSDPAELIQDALKQFLSRNPVRGDKIIISVSGQAGLARFIKLPPVESKKIPDIVKYEARQQIPFPLEEVVWDYQQMVGGSVAEGFALDTEVGLFAMKRDQVYKAMKPFTEAGIEVDIIQLTPLALYNYVAFDQMKDLPPAEEYDPDNPPDSVVVVSLGTDTTDLVVTNGFRVWQRSIPLGGNHFTKALTKEMKLTFATAEHLKRNATQAEDPKALFQAMRPVFSDLLTEIQRSIGYFMNIDKKAKIGRALALGNAMKLPGLQRYLAQNLGFELTRVEMFRGLGGTAVVDQPAFKENAPAFGVCYGLALQGLRHAKIHTNLLPPEVAQDRMIRAKKPWAIAAAAALLIGCGVSYVQYFRAADKVSMSETWFGPKVRSADEIVAKSDAFKSDFETAKTAFNKTDQIGQSVLQNLAGRELWVELTRAINLCLPRNDPKKERPKQIEEREELLITDFECQRYDRLEDWWNEVSADVKAIAGHVAPAGNAPPGVLPPAPGALPPAPGVPPPAPGAPNANPGTPAPTGPTGPGWVIQLSGHHFRNIRGDNNLQGMEYVRNTLLANLKLDEIPLPESEPDAPGMFRVKKLGIAWPVAHEVGPINWDFQIPMDDSEGRAGDPNNRPMKTQPRYDFVVQFCWTEQPSSEKPPVAPPGGGAAAPQAPQAGPPAATPPAVPAEGAPNSGVPAEPAAGSAPATPAVAPAADGAPPAAATPPAGATPPETGTPPAAAAPSTPPPQ